MSITRFTRREYSRNRRGLVVSSLLPDERPLSGFADTVADRPALEITWAAPPPWQNPLGPLDVNADGSIGAADVSAQLTNKTGRTLLELPIVPMPGGESAYQVELPMASIARGDYLLAVAARHEEERARALVPVRVLAF
jgi:hypothetical protein